MSHLWEKEKGGKKEKKKTREGGKKDIEKESKEGSRNKERLGQDKKEFFNKN